MYCHIRSVFFVHSNRKMKWYLEMKCMFWDLRKKKTTHLSYSKTCFYKTPSIIHRFQQFQKSRGSSHTAVALLIEWVQPCALFKKNGPVFFLGSDVEGQNKSSAIFVGDFWAVWCSDPRQPPPEFVEHVCFEKLLFETSWGWFPRTKSWSHHSGVSGVLGREFL